MHPDGKVVSVSLSLLSWDRASGAYSDGLVFTIFAQLTLLFPRGDRIIYTWVAELVFGMDILLFSSFHAAHEHR